MRKLGMAGVMAAAALFAQAARADDAAKERKEAYDATRAEAKQEGREAKAEVKQEAAEAKTEVKQEAGEAKAEMQQTGRDVRTEAQGSVGSRDMPERGTAKASEKKHPLFDGKNNFDMDGKIQKVSKNSITLSREDLPAATLNVSKDTKIELDGEQVAVSQLKQGQDVKASFNLKGDKAEAVEIKAERTDAQEKAKEMREDQRDQMKEQREEHREQMQERR